jgi:glycosyltransferase involved in cell wall biosynthesis
MRIAQVTPRYHPYIGGIETYVREVSEKLVKKGFNVEILTTDPSGNLPKDETINGVHVKRFKSWAPGEAYYFSRDLKKYLAENSKGYDIVHAHNYHALPALYAAQTKASNRLFFSPYYHAAGHTFFRSLLHILYRYVGRRIFEKADKVICISDYEKGLIVNHFQLNDEKIVIIPGGVNLEDFKSLKKRKKNLRTILYVGRLEKYKGVQYLIKAMPKLDDDIILEIVGKGSYRKSLIKLTKKLNMQGRVRFCHDLSREELLQKYMDANVFVMLSKHESYCISVAEALASRIPCIVANTSALKQWIDNKNCFGINYPIEITELTNLINKVICMRVKDIRLHRWEEVMLRLVRLYEN